MIDVTVAGATGQLGSMVCSLIREQKDMRLIGAIVSAEGGKAGTELYPGVLAVGPDGLEELCGRSTVLVNYLLSLPENAAAAGLKIPLHLRLRFKNINAWRQMACKSVLPR